MYAVGVLLLILIGFTWMYGARYRVLLKRDKIRVRSLFGESSVRLDPATKITVDTVDVMPTSSIGLAGLAGSAVKGVLGATAGKSAFTRVTIRVDDGVSALKLTSNINDMEQLREQLGKFEDRILLPAYRARWQAGEAIQFGNVTLTSSTLAQKKNSVPVAEISELVINQNKRTLTVKREGKVFGGLTMKMNAVPNLRSLITMLSDIRKTGRT